MKPDLFLKDEYLKILIEIFDKYIKNAQVLAYGSRIKDTAHSGSDLDLAIIENNEKIPLSLIREALRESNIPFFVEIFDFYKLPESFQAEISAFNIQIYPKQ